MALIVTKKRTMKDYKIGGIYFYADIYLTVQRNPFLKMETSKSVIAIVSKITKQLKAEFVLQHTTGMYRRIF